MFDINWVTESGLLVESTQGAIVSIDVKIEEKYSSYQQTGTFQVRIGESFGLVDTVSIDGRAVYFTVQNQYVQFPVLQQASLIEIRRTPSVVYRLLNGELPPGLALTTSGTIVGTLEHTPANRRSVYNFTIRGEVGGVSRDRSFTISSTGSDSPTEFGTDNMPKVIVDSVSSIPFFDIGSFARAQHVYFTLDIQDQDEIGVPIDIIPVTGLPDNRNLFGGLPDGLLLSGTIISGLISSAAISGRYLFSVRIGSGRAGVVKTFGIDILNTMFDAIDIAPKIVWQSDTGLLGKLIVGEPSYLSVSAIPVYSPALTYKLAPGSSNLPQGLELDTESGNITGRPSFISKTEVSSFVIRASSGTLFLDREFSIAVESPFIAPYPYRIQMPLSAVDATAFYNGNSILIDPTDLFQPNNPSFGRRSSASVFLINSLNPNLDLSTIVKVDPSAVGTTGSYHRQRSIILGSLRSAVARDAAGDVVYEVVYRQIFDPQLGAGGFSVLDHKPVEDKVLYPQTKDSARYVYPNSIVNARFDLINRFGFATKDPEKQTLIGVDGPELMPLWMRSQQTAGDPSSVLGYVPAIVIGYFQPKTSDRNMKKILASEACTPNGTVYVLGRYLVSNGLSSIEIIL